MEKTKKKSNYWQDIKKICTTRNFLLLMLIRASLSIAIDLSETIVNAYGNEIGVSAWLLGALASVMSIMKFVGRPIAGRFVDAVQKPKSCIVISFGLFAAAHLLYMATTTEFMYAISRVLYGFFDVFTIVSCTTAVASIAGRAALGTAFAVFAFVPKLARSVVPMISVWVEQSFGAHSAFLGSAVILCLGIVLALLLDTKGIIMPKKRKNTEKKGFSIHNYVAFDALWVCGIRFFSSFMFVLTRTYLVIYGEEAGFANAAVYFTMYSLASMWGGLVGGPVYDKVGIDWIMYPMLIGAGGATLLIGFGTSDLFCLLAGVLFGFTYGMSNPACSAASQKVVMPDKRGIAAATNLIVPDLCSIVTGVVIGVLAEQVGYAGTFRSMVVFPIVGLIVYTLIRKKIKERSSAVAAKISEALAAEEKEGATE